MLPEIGVFFLVIAVGFALTQSIALVRTSFLPAVGRCAGLQFLCVSVAFAILAILRVTDDFSVLTVAEDSNTALPLLYKIVGTWGNHEGSMLLWVWVLGLFGACLAADAPEDALLVRTAQAVQGALAAGVLLFILFTSNPFARVSPVPPQGADLNPLLQDIGLAMHPPLLYVGYVGFSIVFALGVAAMIRGELDKNWARLAQRWILVAWGFLTIGIGGGSWWAYRELGWGGWWFWDPVENASLLPWLAGTALLHANMTLEKRGTLKSWVLLLSILTFAMSLIGTFMVRSGLITSVHSFASAPARGLFILAYITFTVGGALVLYSVRAGRIASDVRAAPLSREGLIVIGNLFFITALFCVLLGTLYPLVVEWMGWPPLSVGAPYFTRTFLPLMAFPVVLSGIAVLMPWQQAPLRMLWRQAQFPLLAVLAALLVVLALVKTGMALAALGFTLAAWLAAATLRYGYAHLMRPGARAQALGVTMAHLGAALVVAGITGAGLWQQETQTLLHDGNDVTLGGYRFAYRSTHTREEANYKELSADVEVKNGAFSAMLHPAYRFYPARATGISQSSIMLRPWGDIYATLGAPAEDGTPLRIYLNPMMIFLWGGCVLMAGGGLTAAFMRYRRRPS